MSNDYWFRSAAQGQLSECNRRNTVLRAVVKSHKGLKETKVFAFGCFVRNLKNSQNLQEKPLLESFYCKVTAWNSLYKKSKVKVTRATLPKRETYTETLTQVHSCRFWKKYEHDLEHLCETASEIVSKKEFVI